MAKSHIKFYTLVLVLLIIVLLVSLLFEYKPRYLYRPLYRFFSTHSYRTLNARDVSSIRPWMTFDYINNVFKLPKEYLKNTLGITDNRYPNMFISSYAREEKITSTQFTAKVQEAVTAYIAGKQ